MKKKLIISTALILCIACAVIAIISLGIINGKSKPNLLTIDGEEYNLSDDFQEVVGNMVTNDIKVVNTSGLYNYYDEDGKFIKGSGGLLNEAFISASEVNRTSGLVLKDTEEFTEEHGFFCCKIYYINDLENNEIISSLGVSSYDEAEDVLDNDTFIQLDKMIYTNDDYGYGAVFVNGKPLDLSAYEEQLEELKEEEYTPGQYVGGILIKFFPHLFGFTSPLCSDMYKAVPSYEELNSYSHISLDEELLLLFASEDAYEQLENKKADSFIVVFFGLSEEDEVVNMAYYEYYFTDEWDKNKFRNE